jgi:hypothetical protein
VKAIGRTIKRWRLHLWSRYTLADLAQRSTHCARLDQLLMRGDVRASCSAQQLGDDD